MTNPISQDIREVLSNITSELQHIVGGMARLQTYIGELEAALMVHQAAVAAAYDWFVQNTVINEKTRDGSPAVFGMLMTARQDPTAKSVMQRIQDAVREECAKQVCSGCADGLPVKKAHWAANALNHFDRSKPFDSLYGPVQFACKALWNPVHSRIHLTEVAIP